MKESTNKTEAVETLGTRKPITLENLYETAFAATYHTAKILYLGQVKSVKNANGVSINHDGNSGGNDTLRRIMQEVGRCLSTAHAKYQKALNDACTEEASSVLNDYFQGAINRYTDTIATDIDDCIQEAVLALFEDMQANGGEECSPDGFPKACQAVRRYIYQQDTNTGTRIRTTYNSKGEALQVKEYRYVKYPHLYIDAPITDSEGNVSAWDIEDVTNGIDRLISGIDANTTYSRILDELTATQKRVLKYVARGFTNETIRKRLGITKQAVSKHIQAIRRKALQFKD